MTELLRCETAAGRHDMANLWLEHGFITTPDEYIHALEHGVPLTKEALECSITRSYTEAAVYWP